LQEQVAQDVLDRIFDAMKTYGEGKGNRCMTTTDSYESD
jgi:hypothetical protein